RRVERLQDLPEHTDSAEVRDAGTAIAGLSRPERGQEPVQGRRYPPGDEDRYRQREQDSYHEGEYAGVPPLCIEPGHISLQAARTKPHPNLADPGAVHNDRAAHLSLGRKAVEVS